MLDEVTGQLSMVRRGNHFLLMDRIGWVLIDGPWFDWLSTGPNSGYRYVKIPYMEPPTYIYMEADDNIPIYAEFEGLEWERVRWHPGAFLPLTGLGWWARRWQQERTQWGWRTYPDGKLPAYLNKMGWIDDEWWSWSNDEVNRRPRVQEPECTRP